MLKKFLYISLLLASSLFASTRVEYQVSLIGMNMDYREYDSHGDILDSEKSTFSKMAGAEFGYKFLFYNNTNLDFKVTTIAGETDYVGSYLNSDDGYGSLKSTTSNVIEDISLLYNSKSRVDRNINFVVGAGLGYRYWQRKLSSIQIEEYTWFSLRAKAGVEFSYENVTTSLIAQYEYGIKPEMTASGFNETFKLSSADIAKLMLPIRVTVNEHFDLTCTYVFEYQKIKESNVVYDANNIGYLEPDSTAYNQYIKVGIVFKY
jgi:hypothetical protein